MKRWIWVAIGAGLLLWLAQDCADKNRSKWEGRVQDAVGAERKRHEAETQARTDSLRMAQDSTQLFRDSVTVLERLPARLKIVTRTVREGFPTDTTGRDSLNRAFRVIALQDSTIQAQDSVIGLQKRQIGVMEGSGRLWAAQREADSLRIDRLEGLLRDRPRDRWLGFLPKPRCGPGGGLATNGQQFTAGLVAACILPL